MVASHPINPSYASPRPFPLPLIDNTLVWLGKDVSATAQELTKMYGKNGIVETVVDGKKMVVVSGHENIRAVINRSNFNTRFGDEEGLKAIGMHHRGIVVNFHLEKWKHTRRFFTDALMHPSFLRSIPSLVSLKTDIFTDVLTRLGPEKEIPINEMFTRLALDMILGLSTNIPDRTEMLRTFGLDEGELDNGKSQDPITRFPPLLLKFFEAWTFFMFTPSPFWKYIPSLKSKASEHVRNVDAVADIEFELIARKREQLLKEKENTSSSSNDNDGDKETKKVDFLTALLQNSTLSDDEIRQALNEMLLGGTDTSANTLSITIYLLSKNPTVATTLRTELFSVLKDRNPTHDDLRKLPYLDAVLKEVLRVVPIVPVILRSNVEATEIGGYHFPAGSQFILDHTSSGLDAKYFDEPSKFMPERWLDRDENNAIEPFASVPFGGGGRKCPGQHLAQTQIKVVLSNLLRKFTFELVHPDQPLGFQYAIVNQVKSVLVFARPLGSAGGDVGVAA